MVFSNPAYDVTHNKGTIPPVGSPYESVRKPFSLIGRYHHDPVLDVIYAPIGPRLLVTVKHIAAFVGQQIEMQGQIFTVTGFQYSRKEIIGVPGAGAPGGRYDVDACYVFVDKDIPQWFKRIQAEDIPNITPANYLLHIGGGRGGQVVNDAEGWPVPVVDPDYATSIGVRWSIQRLEQFGQYTPWPPNPVQPEPPPYLVASALYRHHDDPLGHPETAGPRDQDSGSPVFVDCGPPDDPWVVLGCVSSGAAYALSPYKGDVQSGTSCSMFYLDDETVRQPNGEKPPPSIVQPSGPPARSTLRRVISDVNTAVIMYDYQTAAWQPIHRGQDLAVQEWFVMTVDGVERLCCVTEDGFLNLYEESDAGDQVFQPAALNNLTLAPVAIEALTRGYTGGSMGFKAGQFARLVVATLAPEYSVESRTEGVDEISKVVTGRRRDYRVYDRPAGVKRWVPDNSNADFFTPYRQDYSVVLGADENALLLSDATPLLLSTFLSLDLSPLQIGLNLDKGLPVDLKQEANHSLRLVRQRGRWHQAMVSNTEGVFELRAVELELQEVSREPSLKV